MTGSGPVLDGDQAAVVELIDRLVADVPPPADDDVPVTDQPARAVLVQQGLFSLAMPESVGGGGADLSVLVACLERLGRSWPALGLACAHAHAAVEVLAAHAGWREHAEAVVAGSPIALLDGAAAHVDGEGADAVLRAEPARVDVGAADPVVVVVEPGGAAGRCVLVPSGSASASFGPPLRRTGLAGAGTRWVSFPGVQPLGPGAIAEQLPGRAGLVLLQLQTAALACGLAGAALDVATQYVREREQFGAPLAELPTIRRTVFDARAAVLGVQHQVAGLAAVGTADLLDPVAVAAVLRSAAEVAVEVTTSGVQLHGGYGYLTDYPAERLLRDAVSLRAAAATTAVARRGAARLLLGAT
jgi:alkylation response protein AidB-like acyl-CoA dehydrogenase